jgi:hypothetical protein
MRSPLVLRVKKTDWFLNEYTSPHIPRDVAWSRFYLAKRHPVFSIGKLRFLSLGWTDVYHWIYLTIIEANKRGLAHQLENCSIHQEFEAAREAEREKKYKEETERLQIVQKEQEEIKAIWRSRMDMVAVRQNFPHLFESSVTAHAKKKISLRAQQLRLIV